MKNRLHIQRLSMINRHKAIDIHERIERKIKFRIWRKVNNLKSFLNTSNLFNTTRCSTQTVWNKKRFWHCLFFARRKRSRFIQKFERWKFVVHETMMMMIFSVDLWRKVVNHIEFLFKTFPFISDKKKIGAFSLQKRKEKKIFTLTLSF